jgi:hypothetical protein
LDADRENMDWASICNNAGSTTGMLVGNSLFLVLESTQFSNIYIRPYFGLSEQQFGIVTLKGKLFAYSPMERRCTSNTVVLIDYSVFNKNIKIE